MFELRKATTQRRASFPATLRAKYIAENFLEGAEQKNWERGMLGYRHLQRQAGLGAVHRDGLPVGRDRDRAPHARREADPGIGTCGGLQPDLKLGDLIVAVSAVPQDATAVHLAGESHTPTADWELVHGAVHAAKELGKPVRVGPIVSSDIFYDPDKERAQRWSDRGILAVEMEAAVLFTLGALRGFKAGCLLTVSDVVVEGEFVRISDEEMKAAVDQMTELRARHGRRIERHHLPRQPGLGQRLHQAGLARDRPPRGRRGSGGRDALQRGPGRDRPRRRARGWERSASWSSAGTEP